MSSNSYYESIREDLIAHLQGMGGRVSGSNITKIVCPSCGKPEAWTKVADPATIHCNRGNHCGVRTHAKTFAPHLFGNWEKRHPPSKKDPKATARAYLKSRSLDPDKFEFEQGTWKEQGKTITTVAFQCPWTDRRWHRLLDIPKGIEGKTRWDKGEGEGDQGQAWTNGEIDPKKELWITEGIFEVLSLQQGTDLQAAATFSASHIPSKFYDSLDRSQKIVIALNSDRAGQEGTEKNIQTLQELGFKDVVAAQPPYGKDWNDLLVAGAFDEEKREQTIEKALWSGRLLRAEDAKDYWEIYRERYPKLKTHIFSWDANTWIGTAKDKDDPPELGVERIADCEIRLLYSLKDTTNQQRTRETFMLETFSRREGRKKVRMTAAELSKPSELTATLLETNRQIFRLSPHHFPTFGAYLLRSNPPSVRVLQCTGYDEESNCFVYPHFAFDATGKLHTLNEQGYFDQLRVIPAPDSRVIKNIPDSKADVTAILQEHWQAFGLNGVLALGFQVATTFSHTTFPILGYHPILSKWGDPNTGKTSGSKMENRMFGMDWHGLSGSQETTRVAMERTLARHSNQVVYINEVKDDSRFSLNKILTHFNRESTAKGKPTNDLTTQSVEAKAALALTWNLEMRASAAEKQRMVSLEFRVDQQNAETSKAFQSLWMREPNELASVLFQLMSERQQIEEQLPSVVLEHQSRMLKSGVVNDRIAGCYALCLAGFQMLVQIIPNLSVEQRKEWLGDVSRQTVELARSRRVDESDDDLEVDAFVEAIMLEIQRKESDGIDPSRYSDDGFRTQFNRKRNETVVAVYVERALAMLREKLELTRNVDELKYRLRSHPNYIQHDYSTRILESKPGNVRAILLRYQRSQANDPSES